MSQNTHTAKSPSGVVFICKKEMSHQSWLQQIQGKTVKKTTWKEKDHKKEQNRFGKVAHACNPNYLRGREREDLGPT
jgi:hypothetical protein